MTMPRQILPNTKYLISRRCTQRQFLLKPCPATNALFLYCLAVAAEKYEVLVHCVNVLSNHYHTTVTDVKGNIPEFMGYLHRLVATSLNASLNRWENVWAVEQPSLVRLQDDEDVLRKMVYNMGNAVSSYLVSHGDQWPGLHTRPADLLKGAIDAPRPAHYFREDGDMPAVATLKLTRPDIFPELSDKEFVARLTKDLEQREAEIRAEASAAGKRFLGLKRLRLQRRADTPTSQAQRRKLRPRIAAVNKWRRIEALQRLKQFIADYREAWLQWKQGVVKVVFPTGTYALAKHASVTCAPP